MFRFSNQKKPVHFIIISTLLTVAALGAALISAVAGQIGEYDLASLGSKAALGLALIIVLYVVPRLARSVRLEYLHSDYSIHIPNSGLIFLVLIMIVTILALSSGNNLLYLVLAVLLAAMFVSWLASRLSLTKLKISGRFPDHIFVDEPAPFEIKITNRKRIIPTFSVAVSAVDQKSTRSERDLTDLAYFPIIPANNQAVLRIDRTFAKRGVYPFKGYVIATRFPLGFVEQHRFFESPGEVVVYPKPHPLDDFPGIRPLVDGMLESHIKGSGSDLYAIRQYFPSDHHHHIDWKATAKTSRLMVREFTSDDERRITICFDPIVDGSILGQPEFADKFERAVSLAAGLAQYLIDEGAECRLLTNDDDSDFGVGRLHLYDMLRRLARINAGSRPRSQDEAAGSTASRLSGEEMRILIATSGRLETDALAFHPTLAIDIEEL